MAGEEMKSSSSTSNKLILTIISFFSVFVLAFAISVIIKNPNKATNVVNVKVNKAMKITSTAFENNNEIPYKYTCDGENVNPPLEFSDIPENAKSLTLIVDDPDAPSGDWIHWLVWNIDPKISKIDENSIPFGAVQGVNDFGKDNWGGPCPPSGMHHYKFNLFALDKSIDIPQSSKAKDLQNAMNGHIIGQSTLVGIYSKK